jgi:hypothetical protein
MFANYCLYLFDAKCVSRSIRILQLAKLLMLFDFPDFGMMMSQSRWGADLNGLTRKMFALHEQDPLRLKVSDNANTNTDSVQYAVDNLGVKLADESARVDMRLRADTGAITGKRKKKLDIAIVSYCNYKDPTFPLPKYSRQNKQAYADMHGYKLYHLEQPLEQHWHPWMNKLLSVPRGAIWTHPQFLLHG